MPAAKKMRRTDCGADIRDTSTSDSVRYNGRNVRLNSRYA
jgi:hypothetical protein